MEIQIKVTIGSTEYSLEEARKIYETLKEIFEKKAAPSDFQDLFREAQKWEPSTPFYPYQPPIIQPLPYQPPKPDWTWRPYRMEDPWWQSGRIVSITKSSDGTEITWI